MRVSDLKDSRVQEIIVFASFKDNLKYSTCSDIKKRSVIVKAEFLSTMQCFDLCCILPHGNDEFAILRFSLCDLCRKVDSLPI